MRFGSWRNKASHLGAFALGLAVAWPAMPLWREAIMAWHQDRYGALVYQCDFAMREHFTARQEASARPSLQAGLALHSAEIALLDCQDYDIYQKWLMQWGLREPELQRMRLEAIEAKASDLFEVVETHEIRY
ncbi:TIGR03982 family His-Xaa-Ser system protein [Sphingosinicella sp. CPCC 101087]|uniref:TIGR03982 family His-Xaa-Ser system protein n=1 Tax=Sphingosinicella sp. CPCC 101087 TaxID=2497754 RepID=UPI00101CB227|nr:TIGR03982 family His-Xaa-Ser system protein [Sphingosinicella sp. CPCC 101087]